ncbi:MAG: tRNA (adenosine(37)-N6)-threonylcarbamoyltransferase complex dimerization subunit type 1 TsaB [Anaerolineales bacterium]|nr:tRNA (adenosine(37)-N6)-threonylcarbamoyltransferase complex dimerization subunit type 1 TsaB [Anaerolineales bacterium]
MLLAMDTSTRHTGIALYDGDEVLYENYWIGKFNHTIELIPTIMKALQMIQMDIEDLKAVAVATGPGSYTGLRIGLAAAKGLALSLHIPIIGIPTFDILSYAIPPQSRQLMAVLEAGRGRYAVGRFAQDSKKWQLDGEAKVQKPEELVEEIDTPVIVTGELSKFLRKLLVKSQKDILVVTPAGAVRRPAYLAEIGWNHWKAGKIDDPATISPFYITVNSSIPNK